jgi:hypothetical protein
MLILKTCKRYLDKNHYIPRIFGTNYTLRREGVKYLTTILVRVMYLPIGM